MFESVTSRCPNLEPRSFEVVLARHVVWALPDPRDALRRWSDLLVAGGRPVLIEGRWSTGTGVAAVDLEAMLPEGFTDVEVKALPDPALWGTAITDERYLLVARDWRTQDAPAHRER